MSSIARDLQGHTSQPASDSSAATGARARAVFGQVLPLGARPCHHSHESTTHYDHDQKLLSFLLVCRVCGTEKLVHSQPYEPRFEPHPARHSRGAATVDHLPGRPRTGVRRAVLHGTPCTQPTGGPRP
jgi:hypothetical protein